MKRFIKFTVLAVFALIIAQSSYAQEWTKTQTEVWQVVQKEWNCWKTGDIAGMTAILHEKYQGWNEEDPLPASKSMINDFFTSMKDSFKVEFMSINPARIAVTENSAVVDYFFDYKLSFGEGDQKQNKEYKGRAVEFYTKEGGKWLLLGDLMVDEDKDQDQDDD
jgi:hypothetical protein